MRGYFGRVGRQIEGEGGEGEGRRHSSQEEVGRYKKFFASFSLSVCCVLPSLSGSDRLLRLFLLLYAADLLDLVLLLLLLLLLLHRGRVKVIAGDEAVEVVVVAGREGPGLNVAHPPRQVSDMLVPALGAQAIESGLQLPQVLLIET